MRPNRNLLGILSLIFGVMLFSTQDAIIKSISGDYAVTFAMATRCLVALPLLVAHGAFRMRLSKTQIAALLGTGHARRNSVDCLHNLLHGPARLAIG